MLPGAAYASIMHTGPLFRKEPNSHLESGIQKSASEKCAILLPSTGYAIDDITCPMLCFLMRIYTK